jgi:hypothetical protein
VVPANEVAFGRTYGDWAAQWWQWALSLPAAASPLFDTADCGTGQSGPVWFLGGKFCASNAASCTPGVGVRTCTVPAGKYLFFPLVNTDDSLIEEVSYGHTDATVASMRAAAAAAIDGASKLSASVDGMALCGLTGHRVQSPVFSFILPEGDLFTAIGEGPPGLPDGFKPGPYFPIVDDGVYVLLEPLRPGRHVIRFHAEVGSPAFVLDMTYYVTVASP